MRQFDQMAVLVARGEIAIDDFIQQFEPFILKTASTSAGRFITKADDEWAVALAAFSQAVYGYSMDRGPFLGFAKLIIKRRCIDYLRSQRKASSEIPVDPVLFGEGETDESAVQMKIDIGKTLVFPSGEERNEIRYEIEGVSARFALYGFSFFDLTECSPKSRKTKAACAKAVAYILKNPIVNEQLKSSKLLPIKTIQNNTDLPRKILENHRKYIIAAVEIIAGDYPYLAEYMRFIDEEMKK